MVRRLKYARLFVLALLFAGFISVQGFAQANPTFSAGGKQTNRLDTSPALANFNALTYIAYNFQGTLYVGYRNGTNLQWPNINTGFAMTGDPAMAVFNGLLYVVYTNTSGVLYRTTSTNGTSFTTPQPVNISGVTNPGALGHPGLATFNGHLYLSYVSPAFGGIPAYTSIAGSTDGSTFATNPVVGPAGADSPTSGSSLAVFNNKLWIAWTTGASNNVVVSSLGTGVGTVLSSYSAGSAPSLVPFTANGGSQALYIYAKANNSGNTLLVSGTYDGINYTAPTTNGSSLSFSPAAIVQPNGQLLVAFRSNFGHNDLWAYTAIN